MKTIKNEYCIIYGILFLFLVYNFFNFYNFIIPEVTNLGGISASFINSDILTLPALFKNLVLEGGKYSDWYLSAAPYFFPDILLFFILSFVINFRIAFYNFLYYLKHLEDNLLPQIFAINN